MAETKALPLRAAYEFGSNNGLADDVASIRSMAIDGIPKQSMVRRGYVIQLFRENGCLDSFIDAHWAHGLTDDGKRRMRRCEAMRERHLASLDDDELDVADDDQALAQSFALEAQLRDYLASNLTVLEPGLRLYEDQRSRGIEYPVDGGRVDILAIDAAGQLVVIELKLSRGRNKALGQLLYYMGWVDKNLPNPPCRGFIIAEDISDGLRLAVARTTGVSLFRYSISMTVEPVDPS